MWHFAFCSLARCQWAKEYHEGARTRGKHHGEAVRMLANVSLRIIIAMHREHSPYNEVIFLDARKAHLLLAS